MLTPFERPGEFFRGNLHGHSDNSDGLLPAETVCARYRDAGYDFVAVTDHFRPNYNFPLTDTRAYRAAGFTTLLGAEVHAPRTAQGLDWHVLAVGLPLDFPATTADETGPSLARRCAEAGAFVAIAHPHWYQLTLDDALSIDAAHAVEVYNHTSAVNADRGDGLAMYDALLSAGRRLGAIAVDDSHWKVADAFGGWVMAKAERNEPEELLEALKAGAYYASQGPLIHDVRRVDDALEVVCSPAASIILLGPGSFNRRVVGEGLTRASLPLEPVPGEWRRIAVRDAMGRAAWTGALWFDA